jgi:fructosamine-3-kinase
MAVKGSKIGTTFSIETSLDSKWMLNEKSEKLLGLNFNKFARISSWNLQIGMNIDKRLVFAPSDQLNSWKRVWSSN